jgi:ketosteroid isomerase-like protein
MIALALALTLLTGQSTDSAAVTKELEQIEQRLATSWKTGDCAAWGAIAADEWSVVHITGAVITKAQAMEMCRKPQAPIEAFTIDQVVVRPFGDTAVVTGRTTVTMGGATPETVRLRFTDVFIRRAGRWQVVASHATRLAP